jgi:plastocyanin
LQRRAYLITTAMVLPVLALGLSACSAKDTPPGPTTPNTAAAAAKGCSGGAPASSDTISISNFTFLQCPDTVKPGATITVDNKDSVTHTLTAINPAGKFNTGDIAPGTTKTFTAPSAAGTYYFDCTIHPFMLGVLIVS